MRSGQSVLEFHGMQMLSCQKAARKGLLFSKVSEINLNQILIFFLAV
jgi:hypothetical protein